MKKKNVIKEEGYVDTLPPKDKDGIDEIVLTPDNKIPANELPF